MPAGPAGPGVRLSGPRREAWQAARDRAVREPGAGLAVGPGDSDLNLQAVSIRPGILLAF